MCFSSSPPGEAVVLSHYSRGFRMGEQRGARSGCVVEIPDIFVFKEVPTGEWDYARPGTGGSATRWWKACIERKTGPWRWGRRYPQTMTALTSPHRSLPVSWATMPAYSTHRFRVVAVTADQRTRPS